MEKTNVKKNKKSGKKPAMKWQKGEYAEVQDMRFLVPYSFLLLCKLWGTTPYRVLNDFMDNLSCGSWHRQDRDEAKVYLKHYALGMGYGNEYYTGHDKQKMFTELEAIGIDWLQSGRNRSLKKRIRRRDRQYNQWYKKWRHHTGANKEVLSVHHSADADWSPSVGKTTRVYN
jgi:hypothetical protein